MSPTVFREGPYRFFFFSCEELRPHIHVTCSDGEAKIWLEPEIALAQKTGLEHRQITEIIKIVKERKHDIIKAWVEHFRS